MSEAADTLIAIRSAVNTLYEKTAEVARLFGKVELPTEDESVADSLAEAMEGLSGALGGLDWHIIEEVNGQPHEGN